MARSPITFEQAERKRQQAVSFLERIGDSSAADEFERMSTNAYAEHKGLRIANPSKHKGARKMAVTVSKADLQDQIDRAIGTLDEAYTPESTREALATAVGEALDILNGEDLDEQADLEDSDLEDEDELGD